MQQEAESAEKGKPKLDEPRTYFITFCMWWVTAVHAVDDKKATLQVACICTEVNAIDTATYLGA